jgi:hypothetical protein
MFKGMVEDKKGVRVQAAPAASIKKAMLSFKDPRKK